LPGIGGGGDGSDFLGLVAGKAAVGVKVPGGMGVGVDPARQDCVGAEVIHLDLRHFGDVGVDAEDFAVADDDGSVMENVAAAVEGGADAEYDGWRRGLLGADNQWGK